MRPLRASAVALPTLIVGACGGLIDDSAFAPGDAGNEASSTDAARAIVDALPDRGAYDAWPPRPDANGVADASVDDAGKSDAGERCGEDAGLACPVGAGCTTERDCEGACTDGACALPTIADGKMSATLGETDVDCGGPNAPACGEAKGCKRHGDCSTGVCSSVKQACVVPGVFTAPIRKLVAGNNHTCALTYAGTAKCWGDNTYGQLGYGDTVTRGKAPGEMGGALPVLGGGPVKSIADIVAGGDHTCVRYISGAVDCFGRNASGQLGIGSTAPVLAPGAGGRMPSMAAASSNCVMLGEETNPASLGFECWGDNTFGQLGAGDTTTRGDDPGEMATLPFLHFPRGRKVQPAPPSAGPRFDNPRLISLGVGPTASHFCVAWGIQGFPHRVACWGKNDKGQLGLEDTLDRGDQPAEITTATHAYTRVDLGTTIYSRAIVGVGRAHTCAIERMDNAGGGPSRARVKCWGDNSRGQLGVGDTRDRGGKPGEMGDALPVVPGLPMTYDERYSGLTQPFIRAGDAHTCILTITNTNGTGGYVKCWGANEYGQLGLGDANDRGDQPGELPTPIVDLGGDSRVREELIASGANHVCAALHGADYRYSWTVKCWGRNDKGQLGLEDSNHRGDEPGEMGDALPPVMLR